MGKEESTCRGVIISGFCQMFSCVWSSDITVCNTRLYLRFIMCIMFVLPDEGSRIPIVAVIEILVFCSRCEIKLPSGQKKLIRTSCRAIIGPVKKFQKTKLYKAGQSRRLGIRPKVRGVAMNPCDHPHGGGEGKSKSSGSFGQCSRTPWGKPTKSGYKTRSPKKKILI